MADRTTVSRKSLHAAVARAAALTAFFSTPGALAGEREEPGLHLTWSAPAECPTVDSVESEVRRLLAADATRRVTVRADVVKLGAERWEVHLVTDVDGAPGERTLDASSCASLASATALILAWILDPSRAPAASAAEAGTTTTPHADPARGARLRVLVIAGPIADVGLLPRAGVAVEVGVGALYGPVRVEVAGADWFSQDAVTPNAEGTRIHLLEGALRGCYRGQVRERFELDPCLGAGLVYANSDGFGEAVPFRGRTGTWGTAHALLIAGVRITEALALRASLGAVAPLARPPFVVLDRQGGQIVLHQPAIVSGRAALGVEVRFP